MTDIVACMRVEFDDWCCTERGEGTVACGGSNVLFHRSVGYPMFIMLEYTSLLFEISVQPGKRRTSEAPI